MQIQGIITGCSATIGGARKPDPGLHLSVLRTLDPHSLLRPLEPDYASPTAMRLDSTTDELMADTALDIRHTHPERPVIAGSGA